MHLHVDRFLEVIEFSESWVRKRLLGISGAKGMENAREEIRETKTEKRERGGDRKVDNFEEGVYIRSVFCVED